MSGDLIRVTTRKELHLLVLSLLGKITPSFTPKYSLGVIYFTLVTPEYSWIINCVALEGPMCTLVIKWWYMQLCQGGRFGSVRLRFAHGTALAVPVFGSERQQYGSGFGSWENSSDDCGFDFSSWKTSSDASGSVLAPSCFVFLGNQLSEDYNRDVVLPAEKALWLQLHLGILRGIYFAKLNLHNHACYSVRNSSCNHFGADSNSTKSNDHNPVHRVAHSGRTELSTTTALHKFWRIPQKQW